MDASMTMTAQEATSLEYQFVVESPGSAAASLNRLAAAGWYPVEHSSGNNAGGTYIVVLVARDRVSGAQLAAAQASPLPAAGARRTG